MLKLTFGSRQIRFPGKKIICDIRQDKGSSVSDSEILIECEL